VKAFAAWVLPRRHWLAVLVVATVQFLPPVACGLLIADGARCGTKRAAPIAGIALLAVLIMSLGGGVTAGFALVSGGVTVVTGFLVGTLLGRVKSLELAFQTIVLVGFALAILAALIGPGPEALAAPLIGQLTTFMSMLGASAEQLEVIRNWDPVVLIGSMFAGVLLQVMVALMLGCWLVGVVDDRVQFGRQFTALRLGRVVGILSMVVVTASLVLAWPFVQYATSMAVIGFLFQGLAIMHAWLRAKRWHWSIAAVVYASVVTPYSGLIVTALCAAGLLDNFFSLRRSLEAGR